MKNKHLVLIFVLTVVLGLVLRQAPWRKSQEPRHSLVDIDTGSCTRIAVMTPGEELRSFERSDDGAWLLTEGELGLELSAVQMQPLLSTLAALDVQRLFPTKRPDTLQLAAGQYFELIITQLGRPDEHLRIGAERVQGGTVVTAVILGKQVGVCWVKGALRSLFSQKAATYRDARPFQLFWPELTHIAFANRDSTLLEAFKSDSVWMSAGQILPAELPAHWERMLSRLAESKQNADYFDETRASEQLVLAVTVATGHHNLLELRFYNSALLDPPDDPARRPAQVPGYVLHSSQHPHRYFSITDPELIPALLPPAPAKVH